MADQWYYEHAQTKRGPFSARELQDLATSGDIVPTDTIWKEGVARGVAASKVKHLFTVPTVQAVPDDRPAVLPAVTPTEPDKEAIPSEAAPARPKKQARAMPVRGIVITSQDGINVQFRKKCSVCSQEDPQRARMMIKRGVNRVSFLCHKCRKMREAEFLGIV